LDFKINHTQFQHALFAQILHCDLSIMCVSWKAWKLVICKQQVQNY